MNIPYTLPHRIHRLLTGIEPYILNGSSQSTPQSDLISQMKMLMNTIDLSAFHGQRVDYAAIKTSQNYQDYRQLSASLRHFKLTTLQTMQEKLAFWINLYNMLMIDAVIHYQIEGSVNEVVGIFNRAGYDVGGYFFSLHDIEQGILRANRGHPAIIGTQFAKHDPRSAFVMQILDPRIHFALVCASESCPAIAIYSPEKIDNQLDMATGNFINSSEVKFDVTAKKVYLSKIFQWYASDFGASFSVTLGFGDASPVLHWIAPYLINLDEQSQIMTNANKFTALFMNYRWSLNTINTLI